MGFGYLDTQNIDFAIGQTESRLRNTQNRLGINFSEFYSRLDGAMSALNANTDAVISGLVYETDADRVSGGATGNKVLQRAGSTASCGHRPAALPGTCCRSSIMQSASVSPPKRCRP